MGRTIATIGAGAMGAVLEQALRTFRPYAELHGYDLHIGDGESGGRPPAWGKVLLLQDLLERYDEVLWLDADLVILDASEDIASLVDRDSFQALVEQISDHKGVNCGVWFLRSCERTKSFLASVWAMTQYIDDPSWENGAVLDLLGYDLHGRASRQPSPWVSGTQTLPQEWNMLVFEHGIRADPARVRHYAATTNDRRERWMRADADRIEGRTSWVVGAMSRWAERHVPTSPSALRAKIERRRRYQAN